MNAADPALAGLRAPFQSPAQSTAQSTSQSAEKGDTAARPRRGEAAAAGGAPAAEDFDAMMAEDVAASAKVPTPAAVPASGELVRLRGQGVPGDQPVAKTEEEDADVAVDPALALPPTAAVTPDTRAVAQDVAAAAASVATMPAGSPAALATVPIAAEGGPEAAALPADPAQPAATAAPAAATSTAPTPAPAPATAAATAGASPDPVTQGDLSALSDARPPSGEEARDASRAKGTSDAAAGAATAASAPAQAAPAPSAPSAGAATQAVTLSPLLAMPSWQLSPQTHAPTRTRAETSALPAGVVPEAVAGQVALAVAKSGGGRKVELRLDPPELGRVEIHLSPAEKGGLHATVIAERADTHELLRRHGEMLARELSSAGYSDVSLSFSSGSDAPVDRGAAGSLPTAGAFAAVAEDGFDSAAAVPARSLPLADGGLDIRL